MRRTFKYRIYPTKSQKNKLNSQLESCRMLYNYFLNERKSLWEDNHKSISMYEQQAELPSLKVQFPKLKEVYAQILQDIATRVDLAYQSFFRRVKSGEKEPGYPRFKSYGRYDSFGYKQVGKKGGIKIKDARVFLAGIGHIKTVFHRELEGTPKTAIIKKSSTGKWYVSFSCELENPFPLPKSELNVGIDVGLETFAYMSDDTKIENPRFFKKEETELAKANRKLAKFPKLTKDNPDSKERLKAKKSLSRVHERVKFKRNNFSHQESRKIINKYQIIAIEDLEINRLKENTYCNIRKSIADVAWGWFFNLLQVKAEEAGRVIIAVNPAYTSQDCSNIIIVNGENKVCGFRKKKTLAERIHKCEVCGYTCNRDFNASNNILRIGLDSLGANP